MGNTKQSPHSLIIISETLGLKEPAQLCVNSLSQMSVYRTFPNPYSCPELLCPGMDISHEERGQGTAQKEEALPFTSSSVFHRPVFNHGLGPACPFLLLQEADGESPGGRGAGLLGCSCWVAVPVCFFLLSMPMGASRSGATEAWLPRCLAQGPAVVLLASETLCWPG